MNNLMLTQGWRRFRWEDVFKNQKPAFEYLPEFEGPVINARITDKTTHLPLQNTPAYLSVPGRKFSFAGSVSNINGLLRFSTSKFYGKNNLVVQSDPVKNNKYSIDLLTPYSDKFSTTVTPAFTFSEQWKDQQLDR